MRDAWSAAMARGDYRAAWAISDAVLAARGGPPDDPALPYHLRYVWDGRPFAGQRVLVRCYHGLGDTLHFARYLAPLRARAASVTLEAQPELLPLLHGMADRVMPFDVANPLPPSECDIEIMELMHALRLPPEAVRPPYLPWPAGVGGGSDCLARSKAGGRVRAIALCARAGEWDRDRSVPLDALLQAVAGCDTVLLEPTPDIRDTAARIAASDLVITVDTMVAHLAGAMNHPTWLLLKAEPDWRWLEPGRKQSCADRPKACPSPLPPPARGGGDEAAYASPSPCGWGAGRGGASDAGQDGAAVISRWYPNTRLFRQHRPGDWGGPLAEVAAALPRAAAGRLSPPPSPRAGARAG